MNLVHQSEAPLAGDSTTTARSLASPYPIHISGGLMQAGMCGIAVMLVAACSTGPGQMSGSTSDSAMVEQGKQTFRFDTFGDETTWTDTLRMHEVIRTAVDPTTACR